MLKALYRQDTQSLYIVDYVPEENLDFNEHTIWDTEPCESMNGVIFDKNKHSKIIGIEVIGVKLEIK